MKIATIIARVLLGLLFTVFGLNLFFHFLPMQLPPGDAGAMTALMFKHGWFTFIGALYVIAGVLLLIGRYVGIALTISGAHYCRHPALSHHLVAAGHRYGNLRGPA